MFKHLIIYIALVIIFITFAISFTSANSVQTIDDLAYVIALGIDVGSKNNLKVTFQFTKPTSTSEGTTGESSPSVIDSIEANSVDSAISLMNTFLSKEINLTHCKFIVFSEEIARQGIGKEIYTFINNVQVRPDANIVVSNSSASDYIKNIYPSLETLVAKFYEMVPRSSEYTGYTENLILGEFFNKMISNTSEPIAILR